MAGRIGQIGVRRLSDTLKIIEKEMMAGKKYSTLKDRINNTILESKELLTQLRELKNIQELDPAEPI